MIYHSEWKCTRRQNQQVTLPQNIDHCDCHWPDACPTKATTATARSAATNISSLTNNTTNMSANRTRGRGPSLYEAPSTCVGVSRLPVFSVRRMRMGVGWEVVLVSAVVGPALRSGETCIRPWNTREQTRFDVITLVLKQRTLSLWWWTTPWV